MSDEIVVATVILPSGGAVWDEYGAIRVTTGRDICSGEPGVQIEQEGGGVPVVLAATQARALARALDAMAGPDPAAPPPLLPPLTAVQRAWVSGMAEAEGVEGLGPRRINWVIWTVWASRRWGTPTAAMLRSLSSAVWRWRDEQGAGR